MESKNYYWMLALIVFNFLGMVWALWNLTFFDVILFVNELYLVMFLLIIAGIGLFGAAKMLRQAWLMLAVFFAANMFNSLYLYVLGGIKFFVFILLIVIQIAGFLHAVKNIRRQKPGSKRPAAKVQDNVPRPVIVDIEKKKMAQKKAAKKKAKKAAKKSTAKKASKKKSAETRSAKKATDKRAKKTAKKIAKKSAAKKTSKKSSPKKSAKKTSNRRVAKKASKKTFKKTSKKTSKKSKAKKA